MSVRKFIRTTCSYCSKFPGYIDLIIDTNSPRCCLPNPRLLFCPLNCAVICLSRLPDPKKRPTPIGVYLTNQQRSTCFLASYPNLSDLQSPTNRWVSTSLHLNRELFIGSPHTCPDHNEREQWLHNHRILPLCHTATPNFVTLCAHRLFSLHTDSRRLRSTATP